MIRHPQRTVFSRPPGPAFPRSIEILLCPPERKNCPISQTPHSGSAPPWQGVGGRPASLKREQCATMRTEMARFARRPFRYGTRQEAVAGARSSTPCYFEAFSLISFAGWTGGAEGLAGGGFHGGQRRRGARRLRSFFFKGVWGKRVQVTSGSASPREVPRTSPMIFHRGRMFLCWFGRSRACYASRPSSSLDSGNGARRRRMPFASGRPHS